LPRPKAKEVAMRGFRFLTVLFGVMFAAAVAHSADDPAAQQSAAQKQQAAAKQAPATQPPSPQQPQSAAQQQAAQPHAAQQQVGQQMAQTGAARAVPSAASIHQEVDFTASPARVYEALLNSGQFLAFSGRPATIDRAVGGASSLFGGHIVARNLELVANKRIVQGWRVVTWPDGMWSVARFELQPKGTGTHLIFDHSSFPDGQRDHLAQGWDENYWTPMKKYLK
jgi:activator of HSP90 ATPase